MPKKRIPKSESESSARQPQPTPMPEHPIITTKIPTTPMPTRMPDVDISSVANPQRPTTEATKVIAMDDYPTGRGGMHMVPMESVEMSMQPADRPHLRQAISRLTQPLPNFQYAVKFVCGKSDGEVVAPGNYFTAINVHNPTYDGIRFWKKVAVALPGEQPGPVSDFFPAKLGPDEAFEIDCPDIFKLAGTDARFLKGFVVIETDVELDVVAVYTAAGVTGQVETLHTERVEPRRQQVGQPDLVPVPDPTGSFCRRDNEGNLIVTVKNQGTAGAGPSVTEVDFLGFGKVSIPTLPLLPGASVDLLFPIPFGCFNPDCEFRITVDVKNQVIESNEANNTASGTCRG